MKKLILWGLLFLTLGLSIGGLIVSSNQKSNAQTNTPDETSLETAKVVEDFWRYSLAGNKDEVKKLIAGTPKDFYRLNGCKIDWIDQARKTINTESLKDTKKSLPAPIPAPGGGWSSSPSGSSPDSMKDMNYISVKSTFEAISEDIFTPYKIIEQRNNSKEALVKIRYGKKGSLILGNVETVLLTKTEKGEWKIFSVALDWENLSKDFGDPICDENSEQKNF